MCGTNASIHPKQCSVLRTVEGDRHQLWKLVLSHLLIPTSLSPVEVTVGDPHQTEKDNAWTPKKQQHDFHAEDKMR